MSALTSSLTSFRPTRTQSLIAGAVAGLLLFTGIAIYLVNSPIAGIHARLDVHNSDHVHLAEPVTVKFDQQVDLSKAKVSLDLPTSFTVVKKSDAIVLQPQPQWQPDKRYGITVTNIANASQKSVLHSWHAQFTTQPRIGISSVLIDGKPAGDPKNVTMTPKSKLALVFSVPMKTNTVTLTLNGQPIAANQVQWSTDNTTATVAAVGGQQPYTSLSVGVANGAYSTQNEPLTDTTGANVQQLALEPTNPSSGIDANFRALNPIEIVLENSGDARPQAGLQQADIVYEYVSEYQISRMTAIYFNKPPGLVGPVRSCRMINPYLVFAYQGYEECSGASVGTLHYLFGNPEGWPLVPGTINDFDQHNHFFRVDFRAAPHNLFTDGDRAVTIRQQWAVPPPNYTLDPPHDDIEIGQPADPPSVPVHFVNWQYEGGSKQYLRFDHGAAFIDDGTHQQLKAKNVVILHVGNHDAGWVEDENGGAHSVWYDMLGQGPAEIWSDGKKVDATWHMGQGGPQSAYQNNQPVWFTDNGTGKVIELNSGLTWIHVAGSNQ